MPSRHLFNIFSRSHSPKTKSRVQLAREKAEIESIFAPSFPNGLPEPYLWKVSHRKRPYKRFNQNKNEKIIDDESALKMGKTFEGLTEDSEFRMSMGQGVKDPSLGSDINENPGLKDNSLDLDVIEVEVPSLVLEMKTGFSNDNRYGEKKEQDRKQKVESSPAFLTVPVAGRSEIPASPKQSPNSPLIAIAQRPKGPLSEANEALEHSTHLDHLERPKFPAGKRSRPIPDDPASPAPSSIHTRTKRAMKTYLERTKVASRAKSPSAGNSAFVCSAASLRRSASYSSRYGTRLPGLILNCGHQLYSRPKVLSTASVAPRPRSHPLIPQIIITPPPSDEGSSKNAVFDFNSLPSPNSPTTGSTVEFQEPSEVQTPRRGRRTFHQNLAKILSRYIDNSQVRNQLRGEICELFAEEKGTAAVGVSAPSS